MINNFLINTDAASAASFCQEVPGLEYTTSYITGGGSAISERVAMFGLQFYLIALSEVKVLVDLVWDAADFYEKQGTAFDEEMWMYVAVELDGVLPIEIEAIPEGVSVPTGTPLVQITNTDPRCAGVVEHVKYSLLRAVWSGSTAASLSSNLKGVIACGLKVSTGCDSPYALDLAETYRIDCSAGNASSHQSAVIGGMAHLLNFSATNNMMAVAQMDNIYDTDLRNTTLPHADYSVMTSRGQEGEVGAAQQVFHRYSEVGGCGIPFSMVIDSFDDENFIKQIVGKHLKHRVDTLSGSTAGIVMFANGSGDPITKPVQIVQWLWDIFGGDTVRTSVRNSVNDEVVELELKVLPNHIRVLQTDCMDLANVMYMYSALADAGFSAKNVLTGDNSGLLQGSMNTPLNQETFGFCVNRSSVTVNGVTSGVFKNPSAESGKSSLPGRKSVYTSCDEAGLPDFRVISVEPYTVSVLNDPGRCELMDRVFFDGELLVRQGLEQIQDNIEASILPLLDKLEVTLND